MFVLAPLVVIKAQPNTPQLRVGGTLSNFILVVEHYFLFLNLSPVLLGSLHPAGVFRQLGMDLKIYILLFLLLFIFLTHYFCVSDNPMEAVGTEPCCQLQWLLTSK